MIKPDLVKLRADLVDEYRNYPNPTGDLVTVFEARAADVIADLCVLAIQTDLDGMPGDAILQGIIGVATIALQNIILNEPIEHRQALVQFCLAILADNLEHDQPGTIEIAQVDVGDA